VRQLYWLFIIIICPVGCSKSSQAPNSANSAESAAVRVKTVKPKQQPFNWTVDLPGSVEPLEVTPIVVKFAGYIKSFGPDKAALKANVKLPGGQPVVIDKGSEVETGQLLATLYIPELESELLEKKALLDKAKAEKILAEKELGVAESQVTIATTMVDEAIAGVARADADVVRWKAELDQVNTQISAGVGDTQTRNVVTKSWEAAKAAKMETEAKVSTARALVLERKAKLEKAAAEIVAAQTRVQVAIAEVERIKDLVGYIKVTAPFDGIITARNFHTGHFAQPNAGNQSDILFTIARLDVLRVYVDVPADASNKANPGATVVVRVPDLGGREYVATVTRNTGVLNPNSRTLRVEIDLENTDRALKAGMYVVAKLTVTNKDSMQIPTDCILAADETHYIYLVEGGKVAKYRVQLGHTGNGVIEVFGRKKALSTAAPWEKFSGSEQVVNGNLGALADGIAVVTE
jgi:HlyD family secretion protein